MLKIVIIIVTAISALLPMAGYAQGILYLSNLGEGSSGSAAVASDDWLAQGFITGTNPYGYILNSIQLLMDAASGTPSGFSVSIYSCSGGSPQNNLGNLGGATSPIVPGTYTYTASGLTLSPSTLYAVVLTAATPVATGAYDWNTTIGQGIGPWGFHAYFSSADGSDWNTSRSQSLQLGIYATAVPEPTAYALAGLGLTAFALSFRRRKSKG